MTAEEEKSLRTWAEAMAWSDAARKRAAPVIARLEEEFGRNVLPSEARVVMARRGVKLPDANDWREARRFADAIRQTA